MTEQKEYGVLHFFTQGEQCYKIDDVALGKNILELMKCDEKLEKKRVYLWFADLADQLLLYHKCMKQAYGYVNPYGVIVTEDDKLLLLDIEAKENAELLKRMQKKSFRSAFVRGDFCVNRKFEIADDLYAFGRLFQFVVEKGCYVSEFRKIEKIKLTRMFRYCAENNNNVEERLHRNHKELEKMCKQSGQMYNVFFRILAGGVLVLGISFIASGIIESNREVIRDEINTEADEKTILSEEEEKTNLELGMFYFGALKDISGAVDILERISSESIAAQLYLKLFEFVQNGNGPGDGQWELIWKQLEMEWERLGVENKLRYHYPLLEACKLKDTEESWKIICEIAEQEEQNKLWNGIGDDLEKELQLCQYLGNAYEVLNKDAETAEQYEKWKYIIQEYKVMENHTWYIEWKEKYANEQQTAEVDAKKESLQESIVETEEITTEESE